MTFIVAVVGAGGFFAGYNFINEKNNFSESDKIVQNKNADFANAINGSILENYKNKDYDSKNESDAPRITSSTKMVYQYHYSEDGKTEVREEVPPYYLINMTKENLEKAFGEWSIVTFNTDTVVIRKNINGKSNQHYIIGEYEGFVAVFYEKPINGTNLKEITETPISTLTEEEQKEIRKGIYIEGDNNLIKAMQDYES